MAARTLFERGSPDCFNELGISWEYLYAWDQPITGATIQTTEEDVRDIVRPEPEPHNPGPLTTAEYRKVQADQ